MYENNKKMTGLSNRIPSPNRMPQVNWAREDTMNSLLMPAYFEPSVPTNGAANKLARFEIPKTSPY